MAEFMVTPNGNAHQPSGAEVNIDVQQPHDVQPLHGSRSDQVGDDPGSGTGGGTLTGTSFPVSIPWSNGAKSEYTGIVQNTNKRRLGGRDFDLAYPDHPADRFSYRRFCL